MTPALPPDDAGLPRSRDGQLAALARMFGDAPPPSRLMRGEAVTFGAPTFTHQPGTLDEARRPGHLLWLWRLPEPTPLDAMTMRVVIRHPLLSGSRRPKTRATCRQLRAHIESLAPHLGAYEMRVDTPPAQWGMEAVKDMARMMASLLPRADAAAPSKTTVIVETYRRHPLVEVAQYAADGTAGFVARVEFPQTPQALTAWIAAYGWNEADKHTHHHLAGFDALKPRRSAAPPEPAECSDLDEWDDEDDLDAIEKAARRALHGGNNIPNTSRPRPQSGASAPALSDEEREIARHLRALPLLRQLPNVTMDAIAGYIEMLVRIQRGQR